MFGKTRRDRIRNVDVRQLCDAHDIARFGSERRKNRNQHTSIMDNDRLARTARDEKLSGP